MTRRLLGPVGGSILFFLVGGLLFAGLGWVTVAALRVEDAQQEAAARAELEHNLHIALWRLDGRMLPSLGVEDSRPYHHYTAHTPGDATAVYGPACAPLLAADLPGWMQLHFEVDAVSGWRSPQVLSVAAAIDFRERWPGLPLHNATPEREAHLAWLQGQFPAAGAVELFARRDRESEAGPALNGVLTKGDGTGEAAPSALDGTRTTELVPPREPSGTTPPLTPTTGLQPSAGNLINAERDRKSGAMQNGPNPASNKDAAPFLPAPAARPVPSETTTAQGPCLVPNQESEYGVRQLSQEKAFRELAPGRSLPLQANPNVQGFGLGNSNSLPNNQAANRGLTRAPDPSTNQMALNNGSSGGGVGGGIPTPGADPVRRGGSNGGGIGGGGIGGAGNPGRGFGAPVSGPSATEEKRKATLPLTPSPASPTAPSRPTGLAAGASPGGVPGPAGGEQGKSGVTTKKLDDSAKGSAEDGKLLFGADVPKPAEQPAMGRKFADQSKPLAKGKPEAQAVDKLAKEVASDLSRFESLKRQAERVESDKESFFRDAPMTDPRDSKKESLTKGPVSSSLPAAPGASPLGGFGGQGSAMRGGPRASPGGPVPRPLDEEAATLRRGVTPPAPVPPVGGLAGPLAAAKPGANGPVSPTPDPAPPAKLEPAPAPPAALLMEQVSPPADPAVGASMPPMEPVPPTITVHPGPMRPQWLSLTDGAEVLVLVRSARLEGKVVYQGVALDWSRLQSVLQEEIKGIFPEGKLLPVKDPTGVSRERAMAALPVQLDPGPTPPPPPVGWTPLRLGLLLAWTAALIAFAAVGLCGWSLIDLAERRIRFVSAVTHELRTPLTSLRLYLDLLLSGLVQDEAKRTEYLSTLNAESDRLHRLIDNVLDFARLERRRAGNSAQLVKVADLLDQLRQTWTDRCAANGKELVVISTLPQAAEVSTNPDLVHQIVGNLIDNARKYTRDATDTRIWVWAKPDGAKRVVFEVEDRGPGVPTRERKAIFRPFRRGEGADTRAGGAGLGLALSKQWAEMLGGRLTHRPADGGTGACFRLELRVK